MLRFHIFSDFPALGIHQHYFADGFVLGFLPLFRCIFGSGIKGSALFKTHAGNSRQGMSVCQAKQSLQVNIINDSRFRHGIVKGAAYQIDYLLLTASHPRFTLSAFF